MRFGLESRREGMTLVEMLVALTIFGILFAATLGFLDQQTKVFNKGTIPMEALQNLRYSLNELEKDLNTVGSNLAPQQPFLVYADTHVVAFNADFSSNVAGDPWAVYVDTAMNDLFANSATKPMRYQIPRTAVFYPDTTYMSGIEISHGETIIFYFEPDTSTTNRTDDYLLWRKVNNQTPDLIARNILKQAGTPFFQYFRLKPKPLIGPDSLKPVPAAEMPARHSVPLHGSSGDTAQFARIDLYRAVKVNYRTTDGGRPERIYDASRTIALPNAGQATKNTCGDEPILGAAAFTSALFWDTGLSRWTARLTWNRATDENSGERDVMRYVLYRANVSTGPFTEPYLSIPAGGGATYLYVDGDVTTGQSYYYALAVQDCTPLLSTQMRTIVPVVIP